MRMTESVLPSTYVVVPQDGIISGIVFINDLARCSNNVKFILNADDSNIFVSYVTVENCFRNINN